MQLTVIIPTHNRSHKLKKCLQALSKQTITKNAFEVIIVDDGSQPNHRQTIRKFPSLFPIPLKILSPKNKGQGQARNLGIQHAKGKIIVLIGDDIIVNPDFLKTHLTAHQKYPAENVACLGKILWDPKIKSTPLMQWLTDGSSILGRFGGHQFAYEKLNNQHWADYNFFYTSNLSLKKTLLQKHPFAPEFDRYGWEDIELGYRLTQKARLKIYYQPKALGYHDHLINPTDFAKRMRAIGAATHIIHAKYPELKKKPSLLKKIIFHLLSLPPTLFFFKILSYLTPKFGRNYYYYALSKKYFLQGLKKQ